MRVRARCVWIRRVHHEMLCIQYVLNCGENNMRATEERRLSKKYIHACDVHHVYVYRLPFVVTENPW